MGYTLLAAFFVVALFSAMLLLLEVGRRIGARQMVVDPEGAKAGLGAVVGVVFSLLGLLLAFTFSGAASRFDARRQLAVQEINTLSKAYYLLDLFPESIRAKLKNSFRGYLDAELEAIKALPDIRLAKRAYSRSSALKLDIQNQVIAACQNPGTQTLSAYVLLPAVNEWIANSTNRVVAANTHPPFAIYAVLVGLALVSSLIAGYAMAEAKVRSWLHIVVFAAVITVTIYVIIDLELPRIGFIRLTATDRLLVELRRKMG
ncbi:MAG TPA: hypothetical protein VFO40_01005 [Chthoniobacterales bacterium]|nr:hypothetical protein [Chthoniobacterales bacterium]